MQKLVYANTTTTLYLILLYILNLFFPYFIIVNFASKNAQNAPYLLLWERSNK